MTPFAFPVVPEVYMMVARSSGRGCDTFPSQVKASSLRLMVSNVSMSMTRSIFSMHSRLSFGSSLLDMNIALLPEWFRMLVTSFSDESGRIGTDTLPKGTRENIATVQFGMFCDRIATLSPAPMPYLDRWWDSSSHLRLKLPYVYPISESSIWESLLRSYTVVEYSYSLASVSIYFSLSLNIFL